MHKPRIHNVPHKALEANETEKRLLDSALGLFSEKGYVATSIREIIERAGVTRPVLYYYFENKEDLFRRLVETWFEELVADMDRALMDAVGCRNRLRVLMRHAFEHAAAAPAVLKLIFQVFFAPAQESSVVNKDRLWEMRFSRIVAIMREGFASGELSSPRSPETLAMVFCGIMDRYLMARCHKPETDLAASRADNLVDLFLQGAAGNTPAAARSTTSPLER
jgi:AcrR family transcriptional regulator